MMIFLFEVTRKASELPWLLDIKNKRCDASRLSNPPPPLTPTPPPPKSVIGKQTPKWSDATKYYLNMILLTGPPLSCRK